MHRTILCLLLSAALPLHAQQGPPRDNPYDVIGKIFQPFWSVLLADTKSPNHAASLTIGMSEVSGRLPENIKGATLKGSVQFPDKVKLEAPVLGEQFTICRNGNEVWATPGSKVEFLIAQFKVKPKKNQQKLTTPIFLPVSAQQAVFLPALFSMKRADVAEVESLNGEDCRVLTAGLMPELAKATKAEDFQGRIWVAAGYLPRRIEVKRADFTAVVDIRDLAFAPSLPASTWQPPAGVTDIYRTTPEMLEALLYIVMNSLKASEGDAPWLHAK
jgi:outer membrane lipoprotein-sorting protein